MQHSNHMFNTHKRGSFWFTANTSEKGVPIRYNLRIKMMPLQ